MIRKLLSGLFLAALAHASWAQVPGTYENNGRVMCPPDVPPQIEAANFINHGYFIVNFTNFTGEPFFTQNTVNYTNTFTGVMVCDNGFRFDTLTPSDLPTDHTRPASTFFNAGTVACGTLASTNIIFIASATLAGSGAKCLVSATNIINPGVIDMGFGTLLSLSGDVVDLTRGTLTMENTGFFFANTGFFFNGGYLDGYWGRDNSTMSDIFSPGWYPFDGSIFQSTPPRTPFHVVTNRYQTLIGQTLGGPTFVPYLSDTFDASGSNRTVRAVFLSNTNPAITTKVFFASDRDIIEWSTALTNNSDVFTNYIYLEDSFGFYTNFQVGANGVAGAGGTRPTFMPVNYSLYESSFANFLGTGAQAAAIPSGTFIFGPVTNQYTAYQAVFNATTLLPADVANQDVTKLPGRIEISADKVLNLSHANINSLNFLSLSATNHYAGLSPGLITSPWSNLNLRSTNGLLYVTNIIEPTVPKPEGILNLYSARWTNYSGGITNIYHVLFADTLLAPVTPARVEDLVLRSTNTLRGSDNIVISDVFTIGRSLLLDSVGLTLTANPPGTTAPCGTLNLQGSSIVWPTATPRLQFLTNNGAIQMANAAFFGGSRTSPYLNTTVDVPYNAFINAGTVTNFASLIWARLFQNSGTFFTSGGGISLQQAQTAYLTNGAFLAPGGDISISTGTLLVSNHVFQAGGALNLTASSFLDDGSLELASADFITNKNTWVVNNGINLLTLPPRASLLGTTVIATNVSIANQSMTWAGQDLGCASAGFANNAALGRLILTGDATDSLFSFLPATGANAIYIDQLEFLGSTVTNQDRFGNWTGVFIAPGMKVYYGQALAAGESIAEKLNGKNGGGFCWVSNYNCGFYSSTFWPYPDFTTHRVNTALAEDCNINSWIGYTNFPGLELFNNCDNPLGPLPPQILADCNVPLTLPSVARYLAAITPPAGGATAGFDSSAPVLNLPPTSTPGSGAATFALAQGSYYGLFADTDALALPSSGYFSATVTARGAFSAKMLLAGRTFAFSGLFDPASGLATRIIRVTATNSLAVRLQLDPSGTDQILGSITDGHWSANLVADRLVFNRSKAPTPLAGSYTMIIPPLATGPAGCGFATLKVDPSGTVLWTATLADGSKVSQSTALSKDGFWPLYSSLYNGSGSIISWMQFAPDAYTDLSGDLTWIKTRSPAAKYYPRGFTNEVQAVGSTFSSPASRPKAFSGSSGSLIFSGGGLPLFTNAFTLDWKYRLVGPSPARLSLVFSTSSGLFKGATLNPDTGRLLPFQGVLMDKSGFGAGFFLGTNLSGQVYLDLAP